VKPNHGQGLRDRIVRYRAEEALPAADMSARIAAYIYGNIIIFAALVPMDAEKIEHGHALSVSVGATVTTFLAHLLAELVGTSAVTDEPDHSLLGHELRNSLPIISTAMVPCLLLAAATWDLLSADTALLVAQLYLIIRIAIVGLVIERLRSTRISGRGLLAGVALALVAGAVVAAKAYLGH